MPDRENVIKALEWCIERPCHPNCPYFTKEDGSQARCLFKKILPDALALLREQEAVKPIVGYGYYICGGCKNPLNSASQKFCSECGRKVKWDD